MKTILFIVSLQYLLLETIAQTLPTGQSQRSSLTKTPIPKNRYTVFVISKPSKLIDPPTLFNLVRVRFKAILRRKKITCIKARSAEYLTKFVEKKLTRKQGVIGNLWFDSHGSYKKGYSFFTIGKDEFSFHNIFDSNATLALRALAFYCDSSTKIGIGSCYGGATYNHPSTSTQSQSRMNGDSLMFGMGEIFKSSFIYACESWVMTKPGLFKESFAMAGYPLRKKFKDKTYKPVWENLGIWNCYSTTTGTIKQVNCIKLDKNGNIGVRFNSYQSKYKVKRQIANNLSKLRGTDQKG